MADKAISELVPASEVTATDLFVLEQAGTAKRLSGQTLTTFLLKLVEAHGGIVSINKTSSSGLIDTYTITMADLSTTSFTVKNGAKGDKGDNSYVWVKYSSAMPTKDSDIYDTPDNYMGIYSGSASKAPTSYAAYKWFQIKGAKGDTGSAASIVSQSVKYQASTNGTVIPSGAWLDSIPTVPPGQYLWTQSTLQFNTGAAQISYSVSRFGMDGSGSVITVNGKSPDEGGNVALTATDVGARPDSWIPTAAEVGARPDAWTPTASDVGAIPNTDASVVNKNLANGAVTNGKIANSTIMREKLAQDALYSPFIGFDATGVKTVSNSDIGRTIRPISGTTDYTINVARDSSIPAGAEIAIFRQQAKTLNIVFASGIRVAIPGETTYKYAPTLTIGDFEMVALKKLASDSNYDYWLVTGNAEVVG